MNDSRISKGFIIYEGFSKNSYLHSKYNLLFPDTILNTRQF